MTLQNFSGNSTYEASVRRMLDSDEELLAIVETEARLISVTTMRIILQERRGGYSVIRNSQISAIEVSQGSGNDKFLKVHFGGGLSRTISAPSDAQALAIVNGSTGRQC